MPFENRVAVITGAAGRIGRALAEELAGKGVHLALLDINLSGLRTLVSGLGRSRECEIKIYEADASDASAVRMTADAVLRDFGKVDILVNNAGIWPRVPFLEMDETLWTKIIDLNMNSVFRMTKAFAPGMVERKYGRIINLGSIAGEVGLPGFSAYAAAKAGVIMLTKTLAMEFAGCGITVNSVSPGLITDESVPHIGTWIGRTGTGKDVARMIAFLADDAAEYITGTDYTVDGGRILGPKGVQFP